MLYFSRHLLLFILLNSKMYISILNRNLTFSHLTVFSTKKHNDYDYTSGSMLTRFNLCPKYLSLVKLVDTRVRSSLCPKLFTVSNRNRNSD